MYTDWFQMSRKIYHRNDMRPALIGMGLSAKRLLLICLSQLERDSSEDNVLIRFDAKQSFQIQVKDYAVLCGIDYSAAYRQVVDGAKELRGYVLEPQQGLLRKRNDNAPVDAIAPFTIATDGTWYSPGEGLVNIRFAKEMEPLISSLTGNFTGQFLLSAMRLPDGNAGKLYLIIREWISSGYRFDRTLTIDELKSELGIQKKSNYLEYKSFNRDFFLKSANKIISKTEFTSITMEIVERRARKAYMLKISYEYDPSLIEEKNELETAIVEKYKGKTQVKD